LVHHVADNCFIIVFVLAFLSCLKVGSLSVKDISLIDLDVGPPACHLGTLCIMIY
jgi:hypothetical protein